MVIGLLHRLLMTVNDNVKSSLYGHKSRCQGFKKILPISYLILDGLRFIQTSIAAKLSERRDLVIADLHKEKQPQGND